MFGCFKDNVVILTLKKLGFVTEIKTTDGKVLFSFDNRKTTLAKEIGKYKNLAWANLAGADLRGANLKDADLWRANLEGANLTGADLRGAILSCAILSYADLKGADLSGADIEGADFEDAINVPDIPFACPSEGSFIAWKKVGCDYLVKLEIPEDARRSSATTNKCRCEKALVLDIENLYTGSHPKRIVNHNYCECVYEVGEMVYPDSFDEDRWRECSNGIHFFMHKFDAIVY